MLRCLFIFLVLIPNFQGIEAQTKMWSLQECIQYAWDENLELKDLEFLMHSNQERLDQSKRDYLPSINAGSNYNVQFGRSIDPNTNAIISTDFFSNSYSLDISVDIFTGFQRKNQIKSNEFLKKAALHDRDQEKFQLAFRVMSAYYDVLYFQEQIEIAEEQLELAQNQLQFVEKQIEVGLKAESDLFESEALMISDELALTRAKNSLKTAKLNLMQQMNLNQNDINISPDFQQFRNTYMSDQNVVDSLYEVSESILPQLQATQDRILSTQHDISSSRGNFYPSLSLNGGWNTGFFETNRNAENQTVAFSEQIKNNASYYYGISLSIPISNKGATKSRIRQQEIDLKRQQNSLDLQKQTLYNTIQELVIEYENTMVLNEQNMKNIDALALAYKFNQRKYEKGLASILEVHQSKLLLGQAQNEQLQTHTKLQVLQTTIDFYAGLPVFTTSKSID